MTIARIPFAIASDESVSKPFSRQRLLNVFPERPQLPGKGPVLILGRWGLKPWATCGTGPIRGSDVMAGILYVVSGNGFYRVDSAGSATLIGTVGGTGFVIMKNNGYQLGIATGNAWVDEINEYMLWGRSRAFGTAYLYNVTTGTFGQIVDPDLFLPGEGKFQWSALDDASSYDALDFATAESSPDNLIRGIVDGADIFMMGESSIEPWYDSGGTDVFDRQNQTAYSKGILGLHAVSRIDNTIMWGGRDPEAGGKMVYRLNGATPQRISTHAVESDLNSVTDWNLVRFISYVNSGHSFLHIILPDRQSWVYDCASQLWHEESTFELGRWQGNSHSYAYMKHVIGSCNSGDLFTLDPNYFYDGAGTMIERELVSSPIGGDESYKTMSLFQVDMQKGVGLVTGQGSDPQIMATYSKDGGLTWSNEKWRSFGKVGDYLLTMIWRQWGQFRTIVIKLRITDPVRVAFYDYFADIL